MEDNKFAIERGVAQGAHTAAPLTEAARKGLIDFLRREILEHEWKIARARASIETYEAAIVAIESGADR